MQSTVQTSMAIGVPGQLVDLSNNTVISAANYSKMLDSVTPDAADTTTVVTIAVGAGAGTAYTYTTDGSDTKAQIAAGLYALINAGSQAVTAYYTAAAEVLYVESDVPGTSITVTGTTSCTVAHVVGNSAAIGFGICVIRDTYDADKARVPILTTDVSTAGRALGVTVHSHANIDEDGYALEECMSICRKGRIYVQVESAVTTGGAAFVRFVAGAGETLGAFRHDADTSDAVALPGAYYMTNTAASGIAIVELNLP